MAGQRLFKFEIGARVAHKMRPNTPSMVVERTVVECYGGRQVVYHLRDSLPFMSDHRNGIVTATEPELVLYGRIYCDGCAYGVPLVDAPGMSGGKAHVEDSRRQSCAHITGIAL